MGASVQLAAPGGGYWIPYVVFPGEPSTGSGSGGGIRGDASGGGATSNGSRSRSLAAVGPGERFGRNPISVYRALFDVLRRSGVSKYKNRSGHFNSTGGRSQASADFQVLTSGRATAKPKTARDGGAMWTAQLPKEAGGGTIVFRPGTLTGPAKLEIHGLRGVRDIKITYPR